MTKIKKGTNRNERKILDALAENARQSLIEISEKTGLSRQTVQKILLKLEKDHIIWGYQPIVDEQKNGLKDYLVLIKRTPKPLDEKLADKVISRKIEQMASKIGVKIVTSFYCHGSYDWITCFMAPDIKDAKKFTEDVKTVYIDHIADIQLLETLFFVKKDGILNPDVNDLKQFL